MRGAGNTEGGWGKFLAGVALLGIGVYLLLDSVRATTGGRKIGTVTYFRSRGRGAKIGDCPYFWRRVC